LGVGMGVKVGIAVGATGEVVGATVGLGGAVKIISSSASGSLVSAGGCKSQLLVIIQVAAQAIIVNRVPNTNHNQGIGCLLELPPLELLFLLIK